MRKEAIKIEVPIFEATAYDGKTIHNEKVAVKNLIITKRQYKVDIIDLIKGNEMTQLGWPSNGNKTGTSEVGATSNAQKSATF